MNSVIRACIFDDRVQRRSVVKFFQDGIQTVPDLCACDCVAVGFGLRNQL